MYDHYQMFVCDENSCDFFLIYSPVGNGMYILCTLDRDDTFLDGIKEIFYAKFTSVILPEIVSRQHDIYYPCVDIQCLSP